jgi:short-subunit dehydrogenase
VNQTGVFYCMKAALQQFLKQGYGNIVNIASLAGLKALQIILVIALVNLLW